MRTRDVKHWITDSTKQPQEVPYNSDDELVPTSMNGVAGYNSQNEHQPINPLDNWPGFIQLAETSVLNSSTKIRVEFLQWEARKAAKLTELDSAKRVELLALLLVTYAKYVDRESRRASLAVASSLIAADEAAAGNTNGNAIKHAVVWLKKESEKVCKLGSLGGSSSSLSSRASLHAWVCQVFDVLCDRCNKDASIKPETLPVWDHLLQIMALTFDSIAGDAQGRTSVQTSACKLTWRTFRNCQMHIPAIIKTLSSSVSPSTPLRTASLLGESINVSLRLRVGTETIKGSDDGVGKGYVRAAKSNILAFYSTQILASKAAVPDHVLKAFNDFIACEVTDQDLGSTLRPQLEKMLLRSPEVALPVATSLFNAYKGDVSSHTKPLLSPIFSASKSTNAQTRAKAVAFFSVLSAKAAQPQDRSVLSNEVLALLKGGKAGTPEARTSLFAMLSSLPAGQDSQSVSIVEVIASMLAKEAQETLMLAAIHAVGKHLQWCLTHSQQPASSVSASLVKEMQNAKVPLRKAVCVSLGQMFWNMSGSEANEVTKSFVESLLPGFEANLKNSSTNMLTAPGGPLEGYITVSLFEGVFSSWQSPKIDSFAKKNPVLESTIVVSPKPSFVLSEKVFRKISTVDEEIWLLRALQSVINMKASTFEKDETVRVNAALGLIHVLLHGSSAESKRAVVSIVEHLSTEKPVLTHSIVTGGILHYLQQQKDGAASPASVDGDDGGANSTKTVGRDLRRLLLATTTFSDDIDADSRQRSLVNTLILSHHPDLLDQGTSCFMNLIFKAKVLPVDLINAKQQDLLAAVQRSLDDKTLEEAGYVALTTLARMAPDEILAELVSNIEADIRCDEMANLTQDEIGIWSTKPGTLYVDVLSQKKDHQTIDKNKKDAKIEQWEAELRESIAKKKAAENKTLTKEQRVAVEAQTKVEIQVRARVEEIRIRFVRSLRTISSLVGARTDEIAGYMQSLVSTTLHVLQVPQARLLVGEEAKEAFWALSSCCSSRLDMYSMFIGVAILRTITDDLVQEDFKGEPISELVLRILYRLRSLSEQSPLDPSSVAFINPLLVRIIHSGGLGVEHDDTDSVLEQIQLALDFITFHGPTCEDVRLPRSSFIESLVHIVAKHSQIAKDAVSSLRSLGEALRTSALAQEIAKLLANTMADEVYVRNGCLQALQPLDLTDLEFPVELWLACHDEDEENARLAEKAWEENGLDVPVEYIEPLVSLLEHRNTYVRQACAKALAEATQLHPEKVTDVLAKLYGLYRERNKALDPEYDRYGMVIESTLNREDPWKTRAAISNALKCQAQYFQGSDVLPFFQFLIDGQALGDRNEEVRQKMLEAASTVIDIHGQDHTSDLIRMFETFFNQAKTAGTNADDGVTEAVVILLGREASHLSATDSRISKVVDRLIEAVKTPSELVQAAVADCLPPLVKSITKDVPRLFNSLFDELFHGAKYASRRGAAYGLAGLVMGRGIGSIKEFNVMGRLADAVEDTKHSQSRQGTMFAYETLTVILQRLFEPYIISILPHLLTCFGDGSADVREATQDTAKAIMQTVSGHGVKLILPTILEGLDEKQWRTKKGAIELLGAMAYCAPKQLAWSLPTIVPRLSEVLTDSHTQVRTAANQSLKQFGEVINNPEIKELVPTLLKALIDPNSKTAIALKRVLETSFVHYIDSPSLALLAPIIDRGLKERSASIQKDAARIVGNLAGLTDSKDFAPYLNKLVPMVRVVLVSPVPDARAVAAKALGTLVERLGEIHFVELVPSLLQVLRSEATGVDRQGAAQGLAEVLAGLGMERMENLLPEIINSASSSRSYVREGHISLLIYLPATFGHRFTPHLGRIIPPILGGIADETESVREASMRAGRMIIANYSSKAVDLLLPHLENGLYDESWRIRLSSLQLTADLLFRLSGISGKNEVEEEDADVEENAVANNSVQKALVEALGPERRENILASIYIVRQDPNIPVRQAAIHTWKALVMNTPRTAREVLPTMLDTIIKLLASQGDENREMAARTLGELVKKLGEKILRDTIPLLRMRGATSEDAKTRAGVCHAVTEILANSTKIQLEDHEDALIAIVRHALVDEAQLVRHAAAQAFDATQTFIGPRAIDETIPTLLEALSDTSSGSSETALAALREVMRARADVVFPVLVPTLIAQPITSFNARALDVLVKVAGSALNRRLSAILTALSKAIQTEKDETILGDLKSAVEAILGSVSDVDGLHQTMILLLGWAGSNISPQQRIAGCKFLQTFCQIKKDSVDMSEYLVDWLRKLVTLFDDPVSDVVDAAWNALDACLKTVTKEEMEGLVVPLRRILESTGIAGRELAGLCRPKGASPLLPVFLAGLMNGTAEQRQQGALGLSDIVERTSAESIKPFVTSMIGPLIRLCGDRHPPPVKTAILTSLDTMVRCIPALVRPFYPQLQRSYQKAVSDSSSATVRTKAGVALGTLMALQARVDPVIVELIQGARAGTGEGTATVGDSMDPSEIADSFALALAQVLANAPAKNVGQGSREGILSLVQSSFEGSLHVKDSFKTAISEVVGSLLKLDGDMVRNVLNEFVLPPTEYDAALQSQSIRACLQRDADALYQLGLGAEIVKAVMGWIGEASSISRPAKESRDMIKASYVWTSEAQAADWI